MTKLVNFLTQDKAALIGSPVAGTQNLSRSSDFPELLLRRGGGVHSLHLGGVLLDFGGHGTYVYACPDVEALKNFHVGRPRGGLLHAKSGGSLYRGETTSYHHVRLMYDEIEPAERAGVDSEYILEPKDLVRWCNVVTPCSIFGFKAVQQIGWQQRFEIEGEKTGWGLQGGWIHTTGEMINITASLMPTHANPEGEDQALVIWRNFPLAHSLTALIEQTPLDGFSTPTQAFLHRVLSEYPTEMQGDMASALVAEMQKDFALPVGVDVVYTRRGETRHVGLGLRSFVRFDDSAAEGYPDGVIPAARLYKNEPNDDPDTGPYIGATNMRGLAVDLGIRAKSELYGWGPIQGATHQPYMGYDLSKDMVPVGIRVAQVEVNVPGFLSDVCSGQDLSHWPPIAYGPAVQATEVPKLGDLVRSTDGDGRGEVLDEVVTREPLHAPDLLTTVANALARAEAKVGKLRVRHMNGSRMFDYSGETNRRRNMVLVLPGTAWHEGGSLDGLKLSFSVPTDAAVTLERKLTTYIGDTYNIYTVRANGVEVATGTHISRGMEQRAGTKGLTGTLSAGGVVYGRAATESSPATTGGLFEEANLGWRKLA